MRYILLLFLFTSLSGIGQPVFQKHFINNNFQYSRGNGVASKTNTLLLLSTEFQTQYDNAIMVSEIDSVGNNIKSITYTPDSNSALYGNELLVLNDSCFLIVAGISKQIGMVNRYNASVIAMVCNDSILWSKWLHDSTFVNEYYLKSVIKVGNDIICGGFSKINENFIANSDTTTRGMLMKIDLNGNIVWANSYGTNKNLINDITDYHNQGVIACGINQTFNPSGSDTKSTIFAVDSLGFPIWEKQMDVDGGIHNVISKVGDNYIIGGNIFIINGMDALLLKIDSVGDPIWIRKFGNFGTGDDNITQLITDNDLIIFSSGSHQFTIYDETSNNAVRYGFSNFSFGRLIDMKLIGSNEIAAIGYTQPIGITNFIKTDTTFFSCIQYLNSYPNTDHTLIISNESPYFAALSIDNSDFIVYTTASNLTDSVFCISTTGVSEELPNITGVHLSPNPVVSTFRFNAPSEYFPFTYSVSDLTGRILLTSKVNSNSEESIDISYLPAGLYLVKIQQGSNWIKLLKQ